MRTIRRETEDTRFQLLHSRKIMAKKPVKFFVVDAFADSAFKGNQAAVCFLEDENERDDAWLQSLAAEFNIAVTCFLTPIAAYENRDPPRFHLRWFSPVAEVDLCGHATLASAHSLFSNGLVDSNVIEFITRSGILKAKRVPDTSEFHDGEAKGSYFIELDFPVIPTCEYNSDDVVVLSKALNGATIIDVKGTTKLHNLLVVLPSWEAVTDLQPNFDEMLKCSFSGIIVTAVGPPRSMYDFCSRYFAPRFGVNEDHVCGSAHCTLAYYWSLKLNKCDFVAYAASRRSGTLRVHLDKEKERVMLRGKAVIVMEGCVLV